MIQSFKSKKLRALFQGDNSSKLPAQQVAKIKNILSILDTSIDLSGFSHTGFALHQLSGNYADFWSVKVSGNYRIIFRFENGEAFDVDYLDYH